MLLPPRDARQMAIVQWGLPLLGGFCWVMWARLRPGVPFSPMALFTTAAVAGWLWSAYAGGVSRYGRVHGLLAPWVIAVLWLYPLGTALLPKIVPQGGAPLDIAFAAMHALTLATAGLWHRARASVPPSAKSLQWDGVQVDVARRSIQAADGGAPWWGPAVAAAALSVPLYAALRALLSVPEQHALAASVMNIVATWLYAGVMGRVFGQALRLGELERAAPGGRFEHAAVREMQAWRRSSWLYRLLQPGKVNRA